MKIVIDIDDMAHDWLVNGFPDEDDMEMALRAIKNGTVLPTGHWIIKPNVYGVTYCSECDFELKIDDTNYCPRCGADMRGGQDE